jgi:hypothetical protein
MVSNLFEIEYIIQNDKENNYNLMEVEKPS